MFTCPCCGSAHITQRLIYCAGSAVNHIKCNACGYDNIKQVTHMSSTTSEYYTNKQLMYSNNTSSSLF